MRLIFIHFQSDMGTETVAEIGIEVETHTLAGTYERKDVVCKTSFLRILSRQVPASAVLQREAGGREYSRPQTMILQPGVHKSE